MERALESHTPGLSDGIWIQLGVNHLYDLSKLIQLLALPAKWGW